MFVGGRRLASLAAALAVAMLAGCSGSSESPRTLPPLSTTPAASASTPPPQDPKAAAVAVVREYFRLLNARSTLANARALGDLMSADCPCRRLVRATRSVAQKSERYFGKSYVSSVTPALDSAKTADVVVEYDYSDGGIKAADGHVISRTQGRRGNLVRFILSSNNNRWLISRIDILRQGHVA